MWGDIIVARKMERDNLQGSEVTEQRGMASQCQRAGLD